MLNKEKTLSYSKILTGEAGDSLFCAERQNTDKFSLCLNSNYFVRPLFWI